MLSKETYKYLCENIFKEDFPKDLAIDYESMVTAINEMLAINKDKIETRDINSPEIDLSYLFTFRWGMTALSISSYNTPIPAFASLFLGIANTTLAIIKLAQGGFDYQASALSRILCELCLTLLAIIIDPVKREAFIKGSVSGEEHETWRKHFTFKKLNKVIQDYELKLHQSKEEEYFLSSWRKNYYTNFSSYVHNDFLSLYLYSQTLPPENSDVLNMNIWGASSTRIESILGSINSLLWYTELLFVRLLTDKNIDINKEYFGITGANIEHWNTASFVGMLTQNYYIEVLKEKENNDNNT